MHYRNCCDVHMRELPEGTDDGDGKRKYIEAVVSSGRTDGHHTWMNAKTLGNFAEDLARGVQFKDSHMRAQGFGVSESGEFSEKDDHVSGVFKLIRGWPLNNVSYPNSDVFIDAIEEGVITRVSVGFKGGQHICSICSTDENNVDLWSRTCYHWPGRKYQIIRNGREVTETCTVEINDARLVEVSAVSSGSNPDAQITEKAQRCYEKGVLPVEVQRSLETDYEMRFDARDADADGGLPMAVDAERLQKDLDETRTQLSESQDKVKELEPLAECGRAAREHMRGEALSAYKTSRGEKISEKDLEAVEKRFERLGFIELVGERDYFQSLTPEPPAVKAGSETSEPDNSGEGREEEKTERRGVNPPHWGRR